MRRTVPILITAAAVVLTGFALPKPAHAGHGHGSSWLGVTGFRVGGLHFSLGYHRPSNYRHSYWRPSYYYRTKSPMSYRGYRCGSACYVRDRYRYHHPRCPVVSVHFQHHRYWPGDAWRAVDFHDPYSGSYYRDRRYGYDDYGYDRDRRYRKQRRGRHYHSPGCGHY